jgi:hypothetical protein
MQENLPFHHFDQFLNVEARGYLLLPVDCG